MVDKPMYTRYIRYIETREAKRLPPKMNSHMKLVRQKNGIDALIRATGWRWEGDGISFRAYDAHGNEIASVLTSEDDPSSVGVLVNYQGKIQSATGNLKTVLRFLASKALG